MPPNLCGLYGLARFFLAGAVWWGVCVCHPLLRLAQLVAQILVEPLQFGQTDWLPTVNIVVNELKETFEESRFHLF